LTIDFQWKSYDYSQARSYASKTFTEASDWNSGCRLSFSEKVLQEFSGLLHLLELTTPFYLDGLQEDEREFQAVKLIEGEPEEHAVPLGLGGVPKDAAHVLGADVGLGDRKVLLNEAVKLRNVTR
jgi:hypothetical protein